MKLTSLLLTQFDIVTYEPFTLYKDHYIFVVSYLNKTKLYMFFFYNSCIIN